MKASDESRPSAAGSFFRQVRFVGRQPIQEITHVQLNTRTLAPDAYCYGLDQNWVSLRDAPAEGVTVDIHYRVSFLPDLTVSSNGVFLFENTLGGPPKGRTRIPCR
jgi:hypothetical protein